MAKKYIDEDVLKRDQSTIETALRTNNKNPDTMALAIKEDYLVLKNTHELFESGRDIEALIEFMPQLANYSELAGGAMNTMMSSMRLR